MNVALWIVQGLLAVIYLGAGAIKVFRTAMARERLPWAGRHSDGFVRFVGAAELLGGLGLILPWLTGIVPWLTPLSAVGLALIQLLAIFTEHIPAKEYQSLPANVLLLALAIFVAYGRFVGLS